MDAFLTRFYADVNRYQGDPMQSKRLTDPEKLLDFYTAEREIFEAMLVATGQESVISRTEVDVTIEDDRENYPLPFGYRQFISAIRYITKTELKATLAAATYTDATKLITLTSGFSDYVFRTGDALIITAPTANAGTYVIASQTDDSNIVLSTNAGVDASATIAATITRLVPNKDTPVEGYRTIAENSPGPGIVIKSQLRGFMIKPPPSYEEDKKFTFVYMKAPVLLHHGTAAAISANTITFDTTPTGGELVQTDGYYNGVLINIYSATTGEQQVAAIKHSKVISSGVIKCELLDSWPETPTGTVLYETVPIFPIGLDTIYALDVAMANSPRRHNRMWREQERSRNKIWNACINYALSGTMDRAPERNLPVDYSDDDPYDQFYV